MAEARLLCSGACRVLGLGDLPLLGRPAALPLAPGEFSPPSAFPGLSQSCGPAAPPQRGSPSCCDNRISHGRMPLHSDVLYYSGEISERQEKEETRSGVPSHPHDEPQRASSGSPSVLVWFLTGKLCPCWEPPCTPGCALSTVFLWLCFQGTHPGHSVITDGKGTFHDYNLSQRTTSGH